MVESKIYGHNWLKKQTIFRAFVSLCIMAIFVPELSRAISSASAPVSISTYNKEYALLPGFSGAVDKLTRDKRNGDSPRRPVPTQDSAAVLWAHHYLAPAVGDIPTHVTPLNSLLRKWLRAACQLLDIPPPSTSC